MSDPTAGPSVKEQFELLYSKLKFVNESALDSAFKVTGFLILVTGWVVTSDNARAFLIGDPVVRWASVFVVLVGAAAFAIVAGGMTRQSQQTFRALQALGFMPVEYFRDMAISPYSLRVFVIIDLVLSLALCTFILRLG